MSVKRSLCSKVVATSMKRRKKWFFLILYGLKYSQNFICLGMTFCKLLWYFKSFMTEVSFKGLVSIWWGHPSWHERVNHTYNKLTRSEEKKENNFLRSRGFGFTCIHFNIYGCLKWLEKPLWLINIKDTRKAYFWCYNKLFYTAT